MIVVPYSYSNGKKNYICDYYRQSQTDQVLRVVALEDKYEGCGCAVAALACRNPKPVRIGAE